MFITSIIIITSLLVIGHCCLAIRRVRSLTSYACQQTCEHYLLTFFPESLQLKKAVITRKGIKLNFEFNYGDDNIQYEGKAITIGYDIKEIILQSPKQNSNDDVFKPANEPKDNVISFPKKK